MNSRQFEPSEEMLKIKTVLESAPIGSYIAYSDLEAKTGVRMDTRGKSLMRSACRSLKISYRCARGDGIELEGPENAMGIVTSNMKRVDNGIKKTTKVSTRLQLRHASEMKDEDRNRLTAAVSLFGAIRAMASGLSKIYSDKPEALNVVDAGKIPWKPK